jgi:hypothetical protein
MAAVQYMRRTLDFLHNKEMTDKRDCGIAREYYCILPWLRYDSMAKKILLQSRQTDFSVKMKVMMDLCLCEMSDSFVMFLLLRHFLSSPKRSNRIWGPPRIQGVLPSGDKAAGSWSWPRIPIVPSWRMTGVTPPLPHIPSWRLLRQFYILSL